MNEFEIALTKIVSKTDHGEHDETIIKALKKQIPKFTKKVEIGEGVTIEVCPVCNKPLNHMMVCCSGCGQLLDWSDCND